MPIRLTNALRSFSAFTLAFSSALMPFVEIGLARSFFSSEPLLGKSRIWPTLDFTT